MTQLSLILPEIGSPSKTEDPKTDNAFTAIQTWANGNIDSTNLKAEGISRESLANVASSIIANEETKAAGPFSKMTTNPDELTVTMRANGLLAIGFQAQCAESEVGKASVAIFLGANQLKIQFENKPVVQETQIGEGRGSAGVFRTVSSCFEGLRSLSNVGPSQEDVTTGQVLGQSGFGGPCYVFAAAGTYVVSVQYKAVSGTVSARKRKLWAWAVGP